MTRNYNQDTSTNTENSSVMNTIRRIARQKKSYLVAGNMRERHVKRQKRIMTAYSSPESPDSIAESILQKRGAHCLQKIVSN